VIYVDDQRDSRGLAGSVSSMPEHCPVCAWEPLTIVVRYVDTRDGAAA
jgi:hypothetical protein